MSLSLNKNILSEFSYNSIFVETGTHTGGGVQIALDCGFKRIISIEIVPAYHQAAKNTFQGIDKVELYLGSSLEILPKIINTIDSKCTFFLDSHLASGDSLSDVEVPLLRELEIISSSPIKTHTILIDDRRGFGYNESIDPRLSREWINVTEGRIINSILKINPQYIISYRNTTNAKDDLLVAQTRGI